MKKEEDWVVEGQLNAMSSAKPTPCPRTMPTTEALMFMTRLLESQKVNAKP